MLINAFALIETKWLRHQRDLANKLDLFIDSIEKCWILKKMVHKLEFERLKYSSISGYVEVWYVYYTPIFTPIRQLICIRSWWVNTSPYDVVASLKDSCKTLFQLWLACLIFALFFRSRIFILIKNNSIKSLNWIDYLFNFIEISIAGFQMKRQMLIIFSQ